ncbi:MAG: putative tricarboxylic transport membrane protein [Granulosicoccus sp.]|jgi:putative tricarboxylic transport membrane protein
MSTRLKEPASSANRPGELVFAIALAVFSAVALWQAWLISGFYGLSEPGVFPMLAAGTMLVSSLFILRDVMSNARDISNEKSQSDDFFQTVLPLRLIVMISLVGLYIASMPWFGFIVASGVFLLASFMYLWRKSLGISVVLTVFSLACIYGIFRVVFQVVLPKGTLLTGMF